MHLEASAQLTRMAFASLCASVALSCAPPLVPGEARTSDGRTFAVSAATLGDDRVQLAAQSDTCAEFIAFRNFPSWQFDSCDTCFGAPVGSGILSSRGELCGSAVGTDWVSVGDCGAAVTVTSSTPEELSGIVTIEKSTGERETLEFRAVRLMLRTTVGARCDAAPSSGPGAAVCCDWRRDDACVRAVLEASCRG